MMVRPACANHVAALVCETFFFLSEIAISSQAYLKHHEHAHGFTISVVVPPSPFSIFAEAMDGSANITTPTFFFSFVVFWGIFGPIKNCFHCASRRLVHYG
jgi:hypothetical protein